MSETPGKTEKEKTGSAKPKTPTTPARQGSFFGGKGEAPVLDQVCALRAVCGMFSVSGHHAPQHRTCPRTTRSSPAATSRR